MQINQQFLEGRTLSYGGLTPCRTEHPGRNLPKGLLKIIKKELASTMYSQICQHSSLCYVFFPQRVKIFQPELIIVTVKFQLPSSELT